MSAVPRGAASLINISFVRKPLLVCSILIAATVPAATALAALATAASTLFESMPFILATSALATVSPAFGRRLGALIGCGCGGGPSARSLPATVAAWLMLGPVVALARFTAAFLAAEIALRPPTASCRLDPKPDILSALRQVFPYAICAGAFLHIASTYVDTSARIAAPVALTAGLLLGFFAAPCALGTVTLAAVLVRLQPLVALGILSIGGIADFTAVSARPAPGSSHDAPGYLLCALACGAVAAHHGDALVHPRFTVPLWICAATCAYLAWRHRASRAGASPRLAPALMLATLLLGSPVPSYHATETTLSNAFAGEHVEFTGVVTTTGNRFTLVRYAIMCCRADARPIAVRLHEQPHLVPGSWVHASGTIVREDAELALKVQRIQQVAPPGDPFVYL